MAEFRDVPLSDLSVETGTRPKGPKFDDITPAQRENGRHLAAIHRHYLTEIAQVQRVLRRIEAGDAPPEDLQDILLSADMTQNLRAFGTICGRECQVLTMHHNIEEAMMFPQLAGQGNDQLRAVVDRLREEHKVVHELLERLASAAATLTSDPTPDSFALAAAIFQKLEATIRSHFRYEETELEDALSLSGLPI